jgi:hypothetical protein
MRLLKKWVPFIWDDQVQHSFDALKHALASTPVLHYPNYNRDFLLYLAALDSSIGIVFVQTDDDHIEHVIYYLIKGLVGVELCYPYVEKLALVVAFDVQRFRHYILLHTTTMISDANLVHYILSRQILGGRYSKWIVILQEFDLEFTTPKAKKSMVFVELMFGLPRVSADRVILDPLPDDSLLLINSSDPWYGYILIYLQTPCFQPDASKDGHRRIRHQAQHYIIIGDALYRQDIDMIMHRCVTFHKAKRILNDCHSRACGGHLSGLATAQKILRAGYFLPTIIKDCMTIVQKFHPCKYFLRKCTPIVLHFII